MSKSSRAAQPLKATPRPKTQRLRFLEHAGIWKFHAWGLLFLWAILFAAYSNSFQAGLFFDNALIILKDPRIQAVTSENIRDILTQGYWHANANSGLYRPFSTFSYLLNYAVFGDGPNPSGYHWVNLVLHAVNVSLVYALGALIFVERKLALALAAMWGLHPLLTESVTNIVGRADLLAAFGVLAGLLCHAEACRTTGQRKAMWLAGLLLAQTIGIFSKENAAILPGMMLLYDLTWPDNVTWPDWTGWRRRAPAYILLAIPFAIFFLARQGAVHTSMLISFSENPLIHADFWTARLTAVKVLGKLLWLLIWPAHLSADYSYNAIPVFGWRIRVWEDTKALIALTACLALVPIAWHWWRTHKPLFFFCVFFFIAMAPTSNLIILIGSIMAERFIYLPSIGFAGCLVAASRAIGRRVSLQRLMGQQVPWIIVAIVCVGYAARTYARNFDWHDERTLWTSAVHDYPEAARPHMNLGRVISHLPGRLPDAITEYQTALRIQPDYAQAHYNLGIALAELPGRLPDAISEYETALRLQPESADARNNLGVAFLRTPGRQDEAIAQWQAALRIAPDHAGVHYNLGNALSRIPGRMMDAVAEWQAALRSEPNIPEAHYDLGNVFSQMPGRLPDAITEYYAAVRIQPNYAEAHNNLANALARTPGRLAEAAGEWQAALRIRPDLAEAHYNLGIALAQMPGRQQQAMAELEAGLRIRPDPAMRQKLDQMRAGQR